MYGLKEIDSDEAYKIVYSDRVNWQWICETSTGNCFWNQINGELMWIDFEESKARYSYKNDSTTIS